MLLIYICSALQKSIVLSIIINNPLLININTKSVHMNILKYILLTCLFLSFHNISNAQEWVSYRSPQQVNDLVENGDELLLASNAGLVVVNKTSLDKSIFTTSDTNLTNDHIQSIALSSNGNTFIGTYDVVVARFDGSDFVDIEVPVGISNPNTVKLYDLEVSDDGDLWVATSEGIFRKQDANWIKYAEEELGDTFFEVWDIEIDQSGYVYAGAQNGVLKFENGSWTNISSGTSLQPYLDSELFFCQNGDLFLAADLDSIARYDGENWELYGMPIGTIHEVRFTEDAEGVVYINNTPNSVLKLVGDSWIPHTNEQTTLYGEKIDYYYIDNQDVHWLSHNIYLSANENGNIQSTSISSTSIEYNRICDIEKGPSGNMYFVMKTSTSSVAVYSQDGGWDYFSLPDGWVASYNPNILYLAADDVWISSLSGLYHYDGLEWSINEELGTLGPIISDSQGKLYVKSFNQIFIVEDGLISEYNESNSELNPLDVVSAIGVDAADNLWIGSKLWNGGGVIQKVSTDGEWTTYSSEDHPLINKPEGDFYFDSAGNTWVPSSQAGVIKFDGQNFTNPIIENLNNLESYKAYSIDSDPEGGMYFSHQFGVTTLIDGVWGELLVDGLPTNNSTYSSSIKFDNDGTLWWGSEVHGLFSYTPETPTSTSSIDEPISNFSIFPNPTENYAFINFAVQQKSNISISVFNNLGQVISSLELGFFNKGTYQQSMDFSAYPKGIYSILFTIDDKSSVKKIVIR
jgi:ligand-binding sensor domain-containing protein